MEPNEPAPWPILVLGVLFTAGAAAAALITDYDVAATAIWIIAALGAYTTCHLTAEHIIARIEARAIRQATGPAPHPNCRCSPAQTTGENQ